MLLFLQSDVLLIMVADLDICLFLLGCIPLLSLFPVSREQSSLREILLILFLLLIAV